MYFTGIFILGEIRGFKITLTLSLLTCSKNKALPDIMAYAHAFFPITLEDLVALGFWRRRGLFGGLTRSDRARLREAMAAVGLEGFESRAIGSVSGGQLQRALFARVLLQDAGLAQPGGGPRARRPGWRGAPAPGDRAGRLHSFPPRGRDALQPGVRRAALGGKRSPVTM